MRVTQAALSLLLSVAVVTPALAGRGERDERGHGGGRYENAEHGYGGGYRSAEHRRHYRGDDDDYYEHRPRYHRHGWKRHGYRNGPPPWAPAYGYRGRHGGYSGYDAPFDIGRGRCNTDLIGAVIGGAAGGLAGSQIGRGDGRTAAVIGGVVLGMIVGSNIGQGMDRVDRYCAGQALEYGGDGQPVSWRSPDEDWSYAVTPTETYRTTQGRYCREYISTAEVAGRRQQVYGTACRQPDGSWELIN